METKRENRIVCQFSCGAASAVATKLTLAHYGHENVIIVNAFLKEEDSDNRRFAADCEKWFDHPITTLRDEKYGASAREVWTRVRFIKGPHGAPCSLKLKRELLAEIAQDGDINILGFTAEEWDRLEDFRENFPSKNAQSPLVEKGLTKADCLSMVERAGIELPHMYRLGYQNTNCIGCPKGGQNYWMNIREDFPQDFVQIKAIQEDIGEGAYFLQFRSGPRKGERMSLSDLPPGRGNMALDPNFSCSFYCELAEREYR
ncbi:MAG TPA: hypothetical protein VN666_21815 [Nitrospira sp.]|nr:hypothetical protein [Nitrospira sp.]